MSSNEYTAENVGSVMGNTGSCAPIGVVINGHREGVLLHSSLAALQHAAAYAAARGIVVDIHLVLDRPDEETRAVATAFQGALASLSEVDFGNLGDARKAGLCMARNDWISFLDGDDLTSQNWLYDAYVAANACARPFDTVFHTELFVGFGSEVFFRRAMRTSDPEFDPLCLVADWFFCNNLFAHRSVFERCPIEPYDHANGFGAEDWHWSCQTIAAGFDRDFVPETAYFYRMKPPGESLGMTPGLMHKASRLFDRPFIEANAQAFLGETAPEPFMLHPNPETPRLRTAAGTWVGEHALQLCDFESQLVEVVRTMRQEPNRSITFPPRMSHGAAAFYRHTAKRLAHDRLYVALFWGETKAIDGGRLLPSVIRSVRAAYPDHEIVVFNELGSLSSEVITHAFGDKGVVVFDYVKARRDYLIPPHYLSLLTAHYFVQFEFSAIVTCGSQAFEEASAVYDRSLAHRTSVVRELAPFLTFDGACPLQYAFLRGLRSRRRFDYSLLCLSQGFARAAQQAAGGLDVQFDPKLRAAICDLGGIKWRGDAGSVGHALHALDFRRLVEPRGVDGLPCSAADRTEGPPKASNAPCLLAQLTEGDGHELSAFLRQAGEYGRHPVLIGPEKAIQSVAWRLASADHVSSVAAENWTIGAVAETLLETDAEVLVIIEPECSIGDRFIDAALCRLLNSASEDVLIPEGLLAATGEYWDYQSHSDIPAAAGAGECLYLGGAKSVGAVAATRSTIKALLATRPGAAMAPASLLACFVASLALDGGRLAIASETVAINHFGKLTGRREWRLLMPVDVSQTAKDTA